MGKIRNLAPDEYYHVCCRIIGGEPLFKNKYLANRFLINLILSNSNESRLAFQMISNTSLSKKSKAIQRAIEFIKNSPPLVEIPSFTLLHNHYHFLLKNLGENNISKFMQRLNTSITMYANNLLNRKGHLFQGVFKCVHIEDNRQLLHANLYIHLNILDNLDTGWREGKLKNWKQAEQILLEYPYSNFSEFLDKRNQNFISGNEIIRNQFDGSEDYMNFLKEWACGNLSQKVNNSITIE